MPDPIADYAREVLQTFGLWRLPVNPLAIVRKEGIEMEEGEYGDRFDARIEFYPSFNSFCIFHERAGGWRTDGRVRFSIAHELGHFYHYSALFDLILGGIAGFEGVRCLRIRVLGGDVSHG